ncbi:MAG: serine/threonine-protein kinase RsbW [Actinomycetota bacterium]|nr:serine/threonine-protein kinase RsbW [Actinomycetota bacterium]
MDTVSVSIPASPAYIQVVRLIASGLASRLRFTIDEIEDLKIAVDELCAYLTGSQGRDGTLDLDFRIEGSLLEIRGVGNFVAGQKARTELTEFSRMILETVADSADLSQRDGTPTFTLVKSKQ